MSLAFAFAATAVVKINRAGLGKVTNLPVLARNRPAVARSPALIK